MNGIPLHRCRVDVHLPQEFKKSSRAARGLQFLNNIIRKNKVSEVLDFFPMFVFY